ncbi:hypothetical protein MAPG_02766 [Magnaporthiopsis poae ATCC 64411]|uniref:Phosphoglycerate mutase n=1 Tax=Magnaporthiopsis poae (strain ATCC 64411 / 73-15) TaxID=644358 RepID=A0A0C4DS89_MAGP6|nr:hypothetical protein MAPG_02766 [Magnaporthiopsis poae ATCC 64411]
MPPKLIFIRHAQALHNLRNKIHDPDLTDLGREQSRTLCKHLQETLPGKLDVDLIIVSPMRRCIQTAQIGLGFLIDPPPGGKKVPVVAHAGWQEVSAKPCDTGSPLEALANEFPFVDFSKVDPVYPDKTSPAGAPYAYSKSAVLSRGQSVLRDLHSRPEKVIAVVSHSGFLRAGVCGWWFSNADYRVFDFAERSADDADTPYQLVQSESTMSGGLGTCWTIPVVLGDGIPEAEAVPAGPEEA